VLARAQPRRAPVQTAGGDALNRGPNVGRGHCGRLPQGSERLLRMHRMPDVQCRHVPAVMGIGWSCLALALCSLAACQRRDPAAAELRTVTDTVSITDGLGRRVTLRQPARRVASLSPSNTEVLYAVGCSKTVVLRDRASDYPRAVHSIAATNAFQLSLEHVAGFAPDVVLVSHWDAYRAAALDKVGFPLAVFDPRSLPAVFVDIVKIGSLCGARDRAQRLVDHLRARLERIRRRVGGRVPVRVYLELDGSDPTRPWTVGHASFVDAVIRAAGGRNIFADVAPAAAQVSGEAVMRRAPTVIVLNVDATEAARAQAKVAARPGWQTIPAVRDGRVINDIDPALLTRPGPRMVEGIERLARVLHPQAWRHLQVGVE